MKRNRVSVFTSQDTKATHLVDPNTVLMPFRLWITTKALVTQSSKRNKMRQVWYRYVVSEEPFKFREQRLNVDYLELIFYENFAADNNQKAKSRYARDVKDKKDFFCLVSSNCYEHLKFRCHGINLLVFATGTSILLHEYLNMLVVEPTTLDLYNWTANKFRVTLRFAIEQSKYTNGERPSDITCNEKHV